MTHLACHSPTFVSAQAQACAETSFACFALNLALSPLSCFPTTTTTHTTPTTLVHL